MNLETLVAGAGKSCPFLPEGPLYDENHVDVNDEDCYVRSSSEPWRDSCRACISEELEERELCAMDLPPWASEPSDDAPETLDDPRNDPANWVPATEAGGWERP
jgi:hypothetical protein